jgi:hypothetical protein
MCFDRDPKQINHYILKGEAWSDQDSRIGYIDARSMSMTNDAIGFRVARTD